MFWYHSENLYLIHVCIDESWYYKLIFFFHISGHWSVLSCVWRKVVRVQTMSWQQRCWLWLMLFLTSKIRWDPFILYFFLRTKIFEYFEHNSVVFSLCIECYGIFLWQEILWIIFFHLSAAKPFFLLIIIFMLQALKLCSLDAGENMVCSQNISF
jgi:hypothetical protein